VVLVVREDDVGEGLCVHLRKPTTGYSG
jgi:hypothetical protein